MEKRRCGNIKSETGQKDKGRASPSGHRRVCHLMRQCVCGGQPKGWQIIAWVHLSKRCMAHRRKGGRRSCVHCIAYMLNNAQCAQAPINFVKCAARRLYIPSTDILSCVTIERKDVLSTKRWLACWRAGMCNCAIVHYCSLSFTVDLFNIIRQHL